METGTQYKPIDITNYVDFCKASAITLIAFWHYYYVLSYGDSLVLLQQGGITHILAKFPPSGLIAGIKTLAMLIVALGGEMPRFFIIASGFGLYLGYLRRKDNWAVFYKKRFIRILPLYWAVVILIYAFHKYSIDEKDAFKVFIYHLLLVQTYTKYSLAYGALWFVGYIAQLYLLFPLMVNFFQNRWLKIFLVVFAIFGNAVIAEIIQAAGFEVQGKPPTLYLACFVFGMLLAEGAYGQKKYFRKIFSKAYLPVFAASAAVLLYLANNYGFFDGDIFANGFAITLFMVAFWLFSAIAMPLPAVQRIAKPLAYSSFALFLSHQTLNGIFLTYLVRYRVAKCITYGNCIVQVPSLRNALLEIPVFIITVLICLPVQKGYDWLVRAVRSHRGLTI
ncbi:MAG: acyltransferase [Actinomycetota bacterium]|nr:acyltransferase [Actinomycetota bacterium]